MPWSLPGTPRLPPLEEVRDATSLVQGLWKLQSSASRVASPPGSAPRPLRSISYLGQVANTRLREADVELGAHESQVYESLKKSTAAAEKSLWSSTGSAGHKEASPLAADAGSRIRPVKQDEIVLETLKMREVKNFKVALPSRPAVLTLTLTKTSGVSPFLWGATQTKRPTNADNEFKGKEDKLVYEHAIMPSTENDGEEGAETESKRVAVPSCREFYFAVDASRGECTFKLVATLGSIKMPDVFSPKVAKTRHGWEARLAEVTKTPRSREEFEEKLSAMQLRRKEKLDAVSRGQNFLERNQLRLALETSPPQRLAKLQKRAIQASYRREVTWQTRQRLEEEQERRHVLWMSRADNKRREREEQELLHATEMQTEVRHKSWLLSICVVSFVKTVMERSMERRAELEKLRREFASATILHSLLRKCLVKKRRNMIWRNAIALRMAVTVYSRTALPMVKAISAPLIKDFVSRNAFNKESPSIHTVFSHYRAGVVRLQHFWVQIRVMRRAYVALLLPVWMACQQQAYEAYHQDAEAAAKARAKAQDEKMAQLEGVLEGPKGKSQKRGDKTPPSTSTSKESRPAPKPNARVHPVLPKDLMGGAKAGHMEERVTETLPRYISEHALYEHVASMHRSFYSRVRAWDSSMQKAKDTAEVENFLNTADAESSNVKQLRMSRPRKIFVDEAAIMELVRKTVYMWHQGAYVHMKGNRLRILRFGFRAFVGERLKVLSSKTPGSHRHGQKGRADRDRADKKAMKKGQSFVPALTEEGSSWLRSMSNASEEMDNLRHTIA